MYAMKVMTRPVVTGRRGSSTNGEGATSAHRLRDPFWYLVAGVRFEALKTTKFRLSFALSGTALSISEVQQSDMN